MNSINTVVISRNLFERLCEAAIEAEVQNRWKVHVKSKRNIEEHQAWCKLKNEALAIRDGGEQS